jgi:pSer/pThr/pTyr-binding forkhead associated (FHA) protein
VKIGDFGITKRVSNGDTALQTATGTPHYMAPEVRHYVDDPNLASGAYTNAVDIWSFACVVYTMLSLQIPFPDPRSIVSFCRGGALPEQPLYPRTSPEGIQFVKSILIALPTSRPTAKEIMTKLWLHIEEASREKSSPDADPQPIQQTKEMAFRPRPRTPSPRPQKPAVPQELSSPNETIFSLLEPFTWVSTNTASTIHDPPGSEGLSSTLKPEPTPAEVASTVSSNQQVKVDDNLPSPSPATITSFFSKEDKVEALTLPESSNDTDKINQKAENLPSICLMPWRGLIGLGDPLKDPLKLLDFLPIFRILPTENQVLKIGRYSASDAKPYDPRNIPSAAPIGFKSKSVSRQHCEVWFSNGQWWIRDVGSSGGTFLNSRRLYADTEGLYSYTSPPLSACPLHDNDLLELGSGSNLSNQVGIRVSLKGWSNRSSNDRPRHVPQQDHKSPLGRTSGAFKEQEVKGMAFLNKIKEASQG